jgi:hypothetical protein
MVRKPQDTIIKGLIKAIQAIFAKNFLKEVIMTISNELRFFNPVF